MATSAADGWGRGGDGLGLFGMNAQQEMAMSRQNTLPQQIRHT